VAIKLLIFDLDGTLVDSSEDISNALNHAIGPYGIPAVSVAETITLVGEGLTRLIEKVIEQKAPGLELSVLVDRFLGYYSDHLADHTRPYPGTESVLQELVEYKKAVVSNKIESLSVKVLEATKLIGYFDYVAGGDTVSEKKPSPVPILDVLSRFDAGPDEALLIGDSIYDIEAGRNASVRTVAARYGYGTPSSLSRADYHIARIEELPEAVRRAKERTGEDSISPNIPSDSL
jgi:phosphoglycolate phosphatase